jgi:hypothetical protein
VITGCGDAEVGAVALEGATGQGLFDLVGETVGLGRVIEVNADDDVVAGLGDPDALAHAGHA